MKQIPLTQGKFALVDDHWFDYLNQWKWYYKQGYAARTDRTVTKTCVFIHRVVMNAPSGMHVDHINHDTLDNQVSNLRICTTGDNQRNKSIQSGGTSQYKGVCWRRRDRKWVAQIKFNGKVMHLGQFTDEVKAAKVYDAAARHYFREFALTNFEASDE